MLSGFGKISYRVKNYQNLKDPEKILEKPIPFFYLCGLILISKMSEVFMKEKIKLFASKD